MQFTALKESGMSLVEMIISIFLISVVFGLLVVEVGVLSISKGQKYENIAYHVANKQMESLRSTPFASLPPSGTISDSLLQEIPSGAGDFTVGDYPNYSGLKEIVVQVTWTHGSNKSVILRTLMGNGGLNSP